MNRTDFRQLINDYDDFLRNVGKMADVGINLFECKYPVAEYATKFFDFILDQNYDERGTDWINWFVYENDFGRKKMEAKQDDTLICQTLNSLYDYIEQYSKIDTTNEESITEQYCCQKDNDEEHHHKCGCH